MMRDSFLQNPTLNLLLPLPKLSGDAAAAAAGDYSLSDQFSSDDFRMYAFKVRRCTRGRSHDWTDCPFAHSGEKARRRDPRNHHYSAVSCPDFRKGTCKKGDACEFAHGVFECWLHPARYRTQICKDGRDCRRRVCFFAHSPEQVRVLPVVLQQRSLISPASSPPVVEEIVASIGSLWLGRVGGEFKQGFCGVSPAAVAAAEVMVVAGEEDEGLVRVESGRGLRVKMYERLSRMGLGGAEFDPAGQSGPDFGWVSELIK